MQNDLISRSEVLNIIHEKYMKFRNESQTPIGEEDVLIDGTKESIAIVLKALHDEIKEMQIAYDVEKVVAELETKAKEHRNIAFDMEAKGFSGIADKQYAKQLACINAIDIVRNGGKE